MNNVKFTFESFLIVSKTSLKSEHWLKLREKVMSYLIDSDIDGVVITHGTNTLEETAYFLHLTVPTDKPIVFVGAQRPFTALGTDTHINLIQAVRLAASDEAYRKWVLTVLNVEISCAPGANKM